MTTEGLAPIREPLRSPRAAGIAGVVFAVLLGTAMVMTQSSASDALLEGGEWLEESAGALRFAMGLLPFAGIAFLWFIGVIRDQVGELEDKLFATVFLGSGLLFLAMLFVWAGLMWAALATYAADAAWASTASYPYTVNLIQIMAGTFTLRMAGVFMLSASSLWLRTKVMPQWVVFLSVAVAIVFLFGGANVRWLRLAFPVWALIVSVIILIRAREIGGGESTT